MLKFRAWMLFVVVVLLAGVVGCATTETRRTDSDSVSDSPPAHASCH